MPKPLKAYDDRHLYCPTPHHHQHFVLSSGQMLSRGKAIRCKRRSLIALTSCQTPERRLLLVKRDWAQKEQEQQHAALLAMVKRRVSRQAISTVVEDDIFFRSDP